MAAEIEFPRGTPAPVRELYWYWRSKASDDRLPGRRDIDPLELRPWLGNLALLEVLGDAEDFRYRLYGTNLVELFGGDETGRNLSTLTGSNRSELLFGYRAVVRDRRARARIESVLLEGGEATLCRLVLPLAIDGEHVDMLLVCVWRIF